MEIRRKARKLRFLGRVAILLGVYLPLRTIKIAEKGEHSTVANSVMLAPALWFVPLALRNAKHRHYLDALRIYNASSVGPARQ